MYTLCADSVAHGRSDFSDRPHDCEPRGFVYVEDIPGRLFRYDECMPRSIGTVIEKRQGLVVLIYDLSRRFPAHNLHEYAVLSICFHIFSIKDEIRTQQRTHSGILLPRMFSLHKPPDTETRNALAAHDDLTAALLSRRGIRTHEEAEAFLSPSYDEHIGDPLQILNMPKAAVRIAKAIDDQERIAVWSDYDCDGIPGGALMHDFLKKAKANFTNYIPHRHLEGFGLNNNGIDSLKKDGVSLIVTIDCGIADVEQVAYANTIGIDVIIIDHHLPNETLPPAYAIVDPKQEGETYPFRDF